MALDSKQKKMLGMTAKAHVLKHKTGEHKMHKTHSSREYCAHCGLETSRSTRHESGHREFDHVDTPGTHGGIKITR